MLPSRVHTFNAGFAERGQLPTSIDRLEAMEDGTHDERSRSLFLPRSARSVYALVSSSVIITLARQSHI